MQGKHILLVTLVFLSVAGYFCRQAANVALDDWNRESYPMKKVPFGVFEIVITAKNGEPAIAHNSKIKVR